MNNSNNINKHLIKIINGYIDYKLAFEDELLNKTYSIQHGTNNWYFYDDYFTHPSGRQERHYDKHIIKKLFHTYWNWCLVEIN
jgi:hypothetical protein